MDTNSATRLPIRGSNNPNFRDDQDYSLKEYKQKYLENIRLFQQFINDDNNASTSPPVVS